MISKIRKRDGRVESFDIIKITNAIMKAAAKFDGTDYVMASNLAKQVEKIADEKYKDRVPDVEQIQDIVEKVLIESGHAKTAKEYIIYRAERNKARDMQGRLVKVYNDMLFKPASAIDGKRENANIDANTSMGTMLKFGSEGAKFYYESCIIPPNIARAHRCGDIHIHDEDFYALTETCCHIDLDKLFTDGFNTGHGFIREPNDITSYAALTCIAIQSNQNEQHGGQSAPKFDYDLAPGISKTMAKELGEQVITALEYKGYVENADNDISFDTDEKKSIRAEAKKFNKEHRHIFSKENRDELNSAGEKFFSKILSIAGMTDVSDKQKRYIKVKAEENTEKKCMQAMEALIHNLNTMHSRAGAQVPFSSINFGTDTSHEGRMVSKCLLLAQEAGMGNGECAIFPITIFKKKTGINYNPEDPNYDLFKLACRVSAKRMFPNFQNIDAPGNIEYYDGTPESEIACMGCRTRVLTDVWGKATPISRGNLSFTSINLPRVALEVDGNIDKFFELLDERMGLVRTQLLHRYKIQCERHVYNFPFLMGQGVWMDSEKLDAEDTLEEALKHGTLGIGFIGLAETLKVLTGKHHGESEESQQLGLKIIGHMRDVCDEYTKEYKLNFGLLGTPAEGLSGRFVKLDKERFGVIEGVTDREYYTNSSHVPVYYPISVKKKVDIEAPYHELENGGHIGYVELDGDTASNVEAFETVIRYMMDRGMGYCSINHPIDRDPVCGYTGVINDVCPRCGRREGEGITLKKLREIEKMYNIKTEGYFKPEMPEEVEAIPNTDDLTNA